MDNLSKLNELDSISMDELQRQLITWVEEKGLLNELRAYLRKKMIFLLKDTLIDQKTSGLDQLCVTPKLQALAILVAEYLLSQHFHYTLSVFTTEAPAITNVDKFCQKAQDISNDKKDQPKLGSKEIQNILESIGMSAHTELCNRVVDTYKNSSIKKESLMGCIVDSVSSLVHNFTGKDNIEKITQGSNTDDAFCTTRSIETLADLNLLFEDFRLKQYQSAIFMFMEKERARIRAEEKAKYKSKLFKHQKLLYQEVKTREEFVLSKLNEAETRLFSQKQQIETNLKRKQVSLQELADELNIIHAQLTRREELIAEAVAVLKTKSRTDLSEHQSRERIRKPRPKSALLNDCSTSTKNSEEQLRMHSVGTKTGVPEVASERKLFSDIILGLQQENAALRNQTEQNRSCIMKLKTKLSKKKPTVDVQQQAILPSASAFMPLSQIFRPNSPVLSPISNLEIERIAISKTSIRSGKSNASEVPTSTPNSVPIPKRRLETLHSKEKENQPYPKNESTEQSIRIELEKIMTPIEQCEKPREHISTDFVRPFAPEPAPRERTKLDVRKKSIERSNKKNVDEEKRQQHPLQIPNVILDVKKTENGKEGLQEIAKKMKPLEDCILYSKRVPNIYYAEPDCAESTSHGDVHQACRKCETVSDEFSIKDIKIEMQLQSTSHMQPTLLQDQCCPKSNYDISDIKFCRHNPNLKENEPEASSKSSSSNVSHASLPRNRKHRKNSCLAGTNIEDMDENELFQKVCKSLGVPTSPTTKQPSKYPELYVLKSSKTKQANAVPYKYGPIFEQDENAGLSAKRLDMTSTLLGDSSMSSCSENSRDCLTPASLILDTTSHSSFSP